MAITGEVTWDMAGGGVTGAVLLGGGWCTPEGGAARAASRPAVSAATVNLARAGPAVMGCSFLGPISGADGVADNWIRLVLLLLLFCLNGNLLKILARKLFI